MAKKGLLGEGSGGALFLARVDGGSRFGRGEMLGGDILDETACPVDLGYQNEGEKAFDTFARLGKDEEWLNRHRGEA